MGEYQVSRDFWYCLSFGLKFAHDRGSSTLDVCDILAGMYTASLDKLSKYWKNRDDFEELVISECGVREPVWFYWIRAYESASKGKEGAYVNLFKDQSPELAKVWVTAGHVAESRTVESPASKPLLTPEDFLVAIARHAETDLGAKLAKTSLDLDLLERTVKTLKPRPA